MQSRRKMIALGTLLLMLIAWWLFRGDPNLARAKSLQKELFSEQGRTMPPEQRQKKWEEFRKVTEKLQPAQRRALNSGRGRGMDDMLKKYVKMTPQERTKMLDDMIARDVQRQKERQQRAKSRPPRLDANGQVVARAGAGPGGGGGPQRGTGPGGGGPRGGPQRGKGDTRSFEEREKSRKERLDHSTADQRAMRDLFRRDMEARRKQWGLPERGAGGGGRRFGT